MNSLVSVVACNEYEIEAVRQAVKACLAPLGGIERFVRPGMRVLLKPNLLSASEPERCITTHPQVVQAVGELVHSAGGLVQVGDSPAGLIQANPGTWHRCGMVQACENIGATLVLFDGVVWKEHSGLNYFIARPVLEADLVINLPKLKTHALTLYTGAVKNLFGVIPGKRKSEVHIRAPGVQDFSRELVNLLELVRPVLTLMDGVGGMEGEGPGAGGTPHAYGCLAASTDPVALDSVLSQAMGFHSGAVVHLAQAGKRGLGTSDRAHIQVIGAESVLDFGRRKLPPERWYMRAPSWVTAPVQSWVKLEPKFKAAGCSGCAKCVQICPGKALQNGSPAGAGNPPRLNKKICIGCMCCAEVCPQGVIEARRSPLARLIGLGG